MSEQNSENPFFTTVFIGNRGTGKTSTLAAMYTALEKANLPNGLALTAKSDETNMLKNKWRELEYVISKQTFGVDIKNPLYQGNMDGEFIEHDFTLSDGTIGEDGNESGISIRVLDTSGGDTASENPKLTDAVSKSFAVMCAVDATFMMECDSRVNEVMNEVLSIRHILVRALNKPDNQVKAVFFLITKCEKYMQEDAKRQKLADKFNKEFYSILEFLQQRRVAVHYMPVQTMGCVQLARIEEDDEGRSWKQFFEKILGKEFDASDAVHPLSILLQLCIVILDAARQKKWDDRPFYEKVWDAITFKDAPERLGGLVHAIAEHFHEPKDWRTNRNGELTSVEPGFVDVRISK